jgi:hypothetical protein
MFHFAFLWWSWYWLQFTFSLYFYILIFILLSFFLLSVCLSVCLSVFSLYRSFAHTFLIGTSFCQGMSKLFRHFLKSPGANANIITNRRINNNFYFCSRKSKLFKCQTASYQNRRECIWIRVIGSLLTTEHNSCHEPFLPNFGKFIQNRLAANFKCI